MNQWKYVKLGEVCTIERGGSPRPIDDFITTDENGINWIKIGDADESMYITKTAQRIKPEGMKKSRYVKPGDFLLSNSMSFGRPYILKIDGCIHDGWLVLRDENNVFDKKFLYYYLSAPITYKRFKSMAVGGVVNNLNSDMVRKVRVPIPSQEEQHQISDRLDKVSNLIFLRKQQLAKLDELVKARFVEMFGGYVPNAKLSDVASITGGLTKNSNRNKMKLKLPYLRVANVSYAKIDVSEMLEIGLTEDEKAKTLLSYDDLLFVEGNGSPDQIGRVALWRNEITPCVHQNHLIKARFISHLIVPCFALYYFMSQEGRKQIRSKAVSTSGLYTLSVSKISNLLIPTPPLSLQNQFAAFVERVDQQKQTVQQSLEKLELMKKALMQEYFG